MTKDQLESEIMTYVASFSDVHGYAPSYREIAQAVGLKSTSTVHKYIKLLEAKGQIEQRKRKSRVVSARRHVTISDTKRENIRRIRLDIADGGSVFFDCCISGANGRDVTLSFSGIFDATQLKNELGRVVACQIEE